MILPNVIIAGGTKCGSTSLYYWLGAHPDVCPSKVKETHFFHDLVLEKFNKSANIHDHDLKAYSNLFSAYSGERIVMEATPQYLFQETPLIHLPQLPSKPKIVFLLREPISRAFSQFVYSKYRLNRVDRDTTFDDYIRITKERGRQADVLGHSSYALYLEKWLERMGSDNILVYQSEELFRNKVGFMKKLANDLGIDPEFYSEYAFLKRNESTGIRNRWVHNIAQKAQSLFGESIKEKILIPLYLKLNAEPIPESESLSDERRKELEDMLWESNTSKLFDLFPNLDVSLWYPNRKPS